MFQPSGDHPQGKYLTNVLCVITAIKYLSQHTATVNNLYVHLIKSTMCTYLKAGLMF